MSNDPEGGLANGFPAPDNRMSTIDGTSYAAAKITGKMIENSTITGTDVKNKSLGPSEIKPESLTGGQVNEAALGTVPHADLRSAARPCGCDDVGHAVAVDVAERDAHAAEKRRVVDGETLIGARRVDDAYGGWSSRAWCRDELLCRGSRRPEQ